MTSVYETARLANVIDLVEFATEELMIKCPILSKSNFEVIEGDDELQLIKVLDFFSEEEMDEHLMSYSITFRASFGMRNIPNKVASWDGRPSTADEIRKTRPDTDKVDCYRILLATGQEIGKQAKTPGVFTLDGDTIYAIQPTEIDLNNSDPLFRLIPNRRNPSRRLILS